MKLFILFFSMFLFMFTPVFVMAGDVRSEEPTAEVVKVDTEAFTTEVIVLEDGTEEELISYPEAKVLPAFVDDRVVAIESEAQESIRAVMEEINQLADKSDEGELQKEIENIKLDAEIARLRIWMEDAEDAQDFDRAFEISDEIDHLENLNDPAIGIPEEQPAPKS